MDNKQLTRATQQNSLRFLDEYGEIHIKVGWVVEMVDLPLREKQPIPRNWTNIWKLDSKLGKSDKSTMGDIVCCYKVIELSKDECVLQSILNAKAPEVVLSRRFFNKRLGRTIKIAATSEQEMVCPLILGNKYGIKAPDKLQWGVWQCQYADNGNNSHIINKESGDRYIVSWGELNRLDLIGAIIYY